MDAMEMEMEYLTMDAKLPEDELIGDDEAKLASLEAKLQAISKRTALLEATHV